MHTSAEKLLYTEYRLERHASWEWAYREKELFLWLFAQKNNLSLRNAVHIHGTFQTLHSLMTPIVVALHPQWLYNCDTEDTFGIGRRSRNCDTVRPENAGFSFLC